ncbi:hypothetical protein [Streptosporangium sp. 'caverna']|uniref:hypothetical protein n=1 Tax=Streptosporangium sp. 'caverna' TaxID=2202249 RepID=UPI0013A6B841|nr:hypothetical protein [Streptosporangium sp. 'caverna']
MGVRSGNDVMPAGGGDGGVIARVPSGFRSGLTDGTDVPALTVPPSSPKVPS